MEDATDFSLFSATAILSYYAFDYETPFLHSVATYQSIKFPFEPKALALMIDPWILKTTTDVIISVEAQFYIDVSR